MHQIIHCCQIYCKIGNLRSCSTGNIQNIWQEFFLITFDVKKILSSCKKPYSGERQVFHLVQSLLFMFYSVFRHDSLKSSFFLKIPQSGASSSFLCAYWVHCQWMKFYTDTPGRLLQMMDPHKEGLFCDPKLWHSIKVLFSPSFLTQSSEKYAVFSRTSLTFYLQKKPKIMYQKY